MSDLDIGVLDLEERLDHPWRTAFIEAARDKGTAYTEMRHSDPDFPGWRPPPRSVLLVDDLARGPWIHPERWVILPARVDIVLQANARRLQGQPFSEVRRQTSRQLALASSYVEAGAKLVADDDDWLSVPGLGDVRPAALASTHQPAPLGELAIYRTLPPHVGTTALWAPHIFDYTKGQARLGGEPLIDLTGRGRILVHGPYIALSHGTWRIEVEVEVDAQTSQVFLRFDWGTGTDVVSEDLVTSTSGRYRIVLDRSWDDNGEAELRVWAARPMFQGRIQITNSNLSKIA